MASKPFQPADYGILSSPTSRDSLDHLNIYDMGPIDLVNHFVETIYKYWRETLIKQDLEHVPLDVNPLSSLDELVVYNPSENCLHKYRVDEMPKEVIGQLEGLATAQDFGVGCFNQLYEELKKAILDRRISDTPEDFGKGVKGAVAMLKELSLQFRSWARVDYDMLEVADSIKIYVVLVDGLGELHKYSLFLHKNADLGTFLEEMEHRFSQYCDPHDQWAYKNWDARVQDLKKTAMDGDPALDRIERLISSHNATENKELPQWMYYTVLEGGDGKELDIKDEESFRAMMDMAAKTEPSACLMRIREAKFRNIFVELRLLEVKQLALAQQPIEGAPKNTNDGKDEPFFDPEPYSLTYFYRLAYAESRDSEGQQCDGYTNNPN